jgi:hypothetical protein
MLQERNFPLPIGQTRLFTAILMGVASGVFIFLGSANLGLLTLTRQLYFFFGVAAGVLLGFFEARTVISKLAKSTETVVWQIVPVGTALFGVPLLLVIALFGVSEYMPFGIYAFFPFITAASAISGWYFSRFEKENKMWVFMFYFGFKYWTQPNPDVSARFYQFLRDVESKEGSQFRGQIGSSLGYIGYAKAFMKKLEENQEIDPARREKLVKILKAMNTYRKTALATLALFLISVAAITFLIFGSAFGNIEFGFNVVDVVGPASGIILFGFFVGVFVLMRMFQRKITRLLES